MEKFTQRIHALSKSKQIALILILAIVGIVVVVGLIVSQAIKMFPGDKVFGPSSPVQFTNHIIDLSHYKSLTPPGTISANTFAPHGYLTLKDDIDKSPIYAPTDADVLFISYYSYSDAITKETKTYDLSLIVNEDLELFFGGIAELTPKLKAVAPQQPKESSAGVDPTQPTSIKAGELLGYLVREVSGGGWDFGVFDKSNQNTVANINRHVYGRDNAVSKYVTGVCAYNYYPDDMKQEYLDLIPSKQCPNSSRDVPGTVAGYWFADKDFNNVEDDFFYFGGDYSLRLVIAAKQDGGVQWSGVGEGTDRTDDGSFPTDPADLQVGDSFCYKNDLDWIDMGKNYLFVKLLSEEKLGVFYGNGQCSSSFPESGFKTYLR